MSTPSKKVWRKAAWLLFDGRVAVHAVGPYGICATVEGEHDSYEVAYAQGEWDCECPHPRRWCSHVVAVAMVFRAMTEGEKDDGRNEAEDQDTPREAP